MKLRRDITAAALALSLVAGVALASSSDTQVQMLGNGQGYGMMNGQGAGHRGFAGPGMRAMGMRGGSQDCWNGNGGSGMGMGMKGMRHGGSGMHHGAMMNPEMRQQQYAFLDATKDLRKQMHDKRFAYMEAQRNQDITQGELQKQEQELYTLRQEIQSKRLEFFKSQAAK